MSKTGLQRAVSRFPITTWLQERFNFRDRGGKHVRLDCPVCRGHRTLSVDLEAKTFHCFRCDDGGYGGTAWRGKASLIGFVALLDRCSTQEAVRKVFALSGMPDSTRTEVRDREDWPAGAIPLTRLPGTHEAVQYLLRRGVGHLVQNASVCVDGKYAFRIILPCDFLGERFGFEAKSYVGARPKSLLSAVETDSGHVYTTSSWDKKSDFAVVTESVIDAETLGVNAVGIFGSVLRDAQLQKLLSLRVLAGVKKLVWFLDWDAWKKQTYAIRKCRPWFDQFVIPLEQENADPNSLGRDECWRLVAKAVPVCDGLDFCRSRTFVAAQRS